MSEDFNRAVSRTIVLNRDTIADTITDRQYEAYPELAARYGPIGRRRCREDAGYHLSYLAEAIATSLPSLFADYVAWAKVMLAGRGIPADDLAANLRFLRDAIRKDLSTEMAELAAGYVEKGLEELAERPSVLGTETDASEPMADLSARYLAALLVTDRREASRLVLDAVESGAPIADIYLHVFQRTQHQIGRLWQMNRLTVAQEHYCTAATQMIMSQLYPRIFATERIGRTMVAACIGGDLHEIGVRMIADFFEMAGWDTVYLGASMPLGNIVDTVIGRGASLLAVSATMTFHVGQVAELIATIRSTPACADVKILVGGYPFNVAPDLWRRIGADASAPDARKSVEVGERLMAGETFR
jgi:MerR family transcriptional regulator, light-induced transcriptional regulator